MNLKPFSNTNKEEEKDKGRKEGKCAFKHPSPLEIPVQRNSSILQEAPGHLLNSMLKMTRVIDNRLKLNALMLKCLNLPGKCNYAKMLLCY